MGINFLGTAIYLFLVYTLFVTVAASIRIRYPHVNDLFQRVAILLPAHYIIMVVAIYGIYFVYPHIQEGEEPQLLSGSSDSENH